MGFEIPFDMMLDQEFTMCYYAGIQTIFENLSFVVLSYFIYLVINFPRGGFVVPHVYVL